MSQNAPKILLIDKPAGITSFDVIRVLRRVLGPLKMGHAGTLDPFATGLMIIALEEETKKLSAFLKLPKWYDAEILFGTKTDTGDVTGKILEEKNADNLTEEKIKETLHTIIGKNEFTVPRYSAIKRNGKPLYAYARAGKEIELPKKEMEVFSAEYIKSYRENGKVCSTVRFHVGSGTYIRTLAEELGTILGIPATLKNLRRTSIGEYNIKDAADFKEAFKKFIEQPNNKK